MRKILNNIIDIILLRPDKNFKMISTGQELLFAIFWTIIINAFIWGWVVFMINSYK